MIPKPKIKRKMLFFSEQYRFFFCKEIGFLERRELIFTFTCRLLRY
ncbi:MAG: hypothetical protein RI580_03040 [Halothece sp. Uz-M2-17]|nr:hypothetical protein [Halothece sp. Uz-M2-17]